MTADASIDDLFSGNSEEDAPRRHRSRSTAVVIRTAALSAGLTGCCWVAFRIGGLAVSPPFLFLACLAIVVVLTAASAVRPPLASRQAGRHKPADETAPDGLTHAVKRWQNRLDWCGNDAVAFHSKITPRLADIVDERLRQRHGIIRSSEPHRAEPIVGEPLWTFLNGASRRPPTSSELSYLIDQMEKI